MKRRYRKPNPLREARDAAQVAAARAADERRLEIIKNLPKPPPDPRAVTAPAEIAERQAQWKAWHASLTDEQRDALRVAHNRASMQNPALERLR